MVVDRMAAKNRHSAGPGGYRREHARCSWTARWVRTRDHEIGLSRGEDIDTEEALRLGLGERGAQVAVETVLNVRLREHR